MLPHAVGEVRLVLRTRYCPRYSAGGNQTSGCHTKQLRTARAAPDSGGKTELTLWCRLRNKVAVRRSEGVHRLSHRPDHRCPSGERSRGGDPGNTSSWSRWLSCLTSDLGPGWLQGTESEGGRDSTVARTHSAEQEDARARGPQLEDAATTITAAAAGGSSIGIRWTQLEASQCISAAGCCDGASLIVGHVAAREEKHTLRHTLAASVEVL